MADEPVSPQERIDDAAKMLDMSSISPSLPLLSSQQNGLVNSSSSIEDTQKQNDEEKKESVTISPPSNMSESSQTDIHAVIPETPPPPSAESFIVPPNDPISSENTVVPPNNETKEKPKPIKKKKRGILIAGLVLLILTLPVAIYYITQSPQFAEIRSRATTTGTYPNSCPNTDSSCQVGGSNYREWLPNHVICGTCTDGDNVCGTWEGEPGVIKSACCLGSCTVTGSQYPWTFEDYCLSTHTSNREACYHSATDCARVHPCNTTGTPTSTGNPNNTPTHTSTPTGTVTITPTDTDTSTPTGTDTNTPTPTNTPTTPIPGACDASCGSDSECESGLNCLTVTGVKRCRRAACSDHLDCSCPSTATPTVYATTTSSYASLISTATPTAQPTPKIPVSGIGPGVVGTLSVTGSIILLILGLAL
jgi:hypothetical protein